MMLKLVTLSAVEEPPKAKKPGRKRKSEAGKFSEIILSADYSVLASECLMSSYREYKNRSAGSTSRDKWI